MYGGHSLFQDFRGCSPGRTQAVPVALSAFTDQVARHSEIEASGETCGCAGHQDLRVGLRGVSASQFQ
jgi:hypothetical protein